MSIADFFVVGVAASFLGFIVWANLHHRKHSARNRQTEAQRRLRDDGLAEQTEFTSR